MSPADKLRRVFELTATVDGLARARLREEFPEASERELRLRVAALRYDEATMQRVLRRGSVDDGRTTR